MLFNQFLAEEKFPEELKKAIVTPIFKKGENFGFRKKVSTIDALVYCTETIRYHINNNNFITAALLDLSKAFDSINYKIFLHKLHELGFSENALNLIESYLSHRLQKIMVSHVESD